MKGGVTGYTEQMLVNVGEGETQEVTVSDGTTISVDRTDHTPQISVPDYEGLVSAVFSDQELEEVQVKNVIVKVDSIQPEEELKQKAEEQLADDEGMGICLDISIIKTIIDEDKELVSENVTNLNQPIRLTLDIPEEFRGMKEYFILREHNGVIDRLNDLDNDPDTITFETDRFSNYLLGYKVSEDTEDEKPVIKPITPPVSEEDKDAVYVSVSETDKNKSGDEKAENSEVKAVKTGDVSELIVLFEVMAAVSGITAAACIGLIQRKK